MMAPLRSLALLCALAAPPAGLAQGQDKTLADIRQELSVLYGDIQSLRGELNTTGGVSGSVALIRFGDFANSRIQLRILDCLLDFFPEFFRRECVEIDR